MPRIEYLGKLHRLSGNPVADRHTVEKLHGDERLSFGLVDFVDGADVRMVQSRRGPGLSPEPAQGLRVVRQVVGKELQGDVSTKLQVFRLVYNTHAPAADFAQDAVMGNRLTHGLREGVDTGENVTRELGEGQ